MKLLTFLGVGPYSETIYTWQEHEYATRFAPAASAHFLQPERLVVFLTEDAQAAIFSQFEYELPTSVQAKLLPIPLGKDENELWQIFARVTEAVDPGERVAFDITHGLRSFPLVGLLVAAYLRAGLNVDLAAVLYGAYDIGKQISPGYTPMFDLSPMLALLEWAVAADRFNRTGDARYLASLLEDQRKRLALSAQEDPVILQEAGFLGNLAGALAGISRSLSLIRPHQVMEQSAGLAARVERAQPALERAPSALPFKLLLEGIVAAYTPLANTSPLEPQGARETLQVERALIQWYSEREHWVQAVSLAREWLVSWIMIQLGLTSTTLLSVRQRIEGVVGAEASDYKNAKESGLLFSPVFLVNIPQIEPVLSLWLSLTETRNDIDHAGMRESPAKPENLIRRIEQCLRIIDQLPI